MRGVGCTNLDHGQRIAAGHGPDEAWATLGVVGPTYMDYPSTIAAVRAVARYVGRFLAEG